MKKHERIVYNEDGVDTGVREDNAGNVYIDQEVYFDKKEVRDALKILSDLDI